MMTKKCYYCSYPNKDDAVCCINCGIELNKYWQHIDGRPELIDKKRR